MNILNSQKTEGKLPDGFRRLLTAVIDMYTRIRMDEYRPLDEQVFQDPKDRETYMRVFYRDNYNYPDLVEVLRKTSHPEGFVVMKMMQLHLNHKEIK
jgi:hypothetical protein